MARSRQLLEKREMCKVDYLAGTGTIEEIAARYGVELNTLKDWIMQGRYGDEPWTNLKKTARCHKKRELMEEASVHLPSVFKKAGEVLDSGLSHIMTNMTLGKYDEHQVVDVVKNVASALTKIYKILRLDDNKSTGNVAINVDSKKSAKEMLNTLSDKGILDINPELLEDDK